MTVLQAATALTTLSIVLVLLLSLAARVRFRQAFFGYWIWAHVWELTSILADLLAKSVGRASVLMLAIAGSIWLSLWYAAQTALALRGRPWPAIGMWGGLGVIVGSTGLCLAMGWSYVPAVMPVFLLIPVALGWLGLTFVRLGGRDHRMHVMWLGLPLLGRAALGLIFPVVITTSWEWVFQGISTLLHVMTGIGMVLYLAIETLDRLDERKAELVARNEDLRKLDKLKDDFVATVSHELRTPLTAIRGSAELMTMTELSAEDTRRFLDTVHANAVHLEMLVSDLLDFTLLRSGEMTYDREVADLGVVVLETIDSQAPGLAAQGLTLIREVDHAAMPVCHDYVRIRQVLVHLLSNAGKYTPAEGRVTVRAWAADGRAHLTVSDTGVGIAPEHHARVFEQFYQVDGSSTRGHGGAGLGLAICRAIIQDGHQGTITVESACGAGSTFHLTLPLAAIGVEAR